MYRQNHDVYAAVHPDCQKVKTNKNYKGEFIFRNNVKIKMIQRT